MAPGPGQVNSFFHKNCIQALIALIWRGARPAVL